MDENPLKVVIKSKDRQTVIYIQSARTLSDLKKSVSERLGDSIKDLTFRTYWIDNDKDEIDVFNRDDFEFFLKEHEHALTGLPKLYFEAIKEPEPEKQGTKPQVPLNEDSLSMHATVECDVCLTAPIRGFRYKCMQCPNFDLCMKCESEMKHPDHMMLRIPHSNSPRIETVIPGMFLGKTARRQQKLAARAAAAANATALGAEQSTGEGKTRHHRHHRKQCSGVGLLSNFYDMMQDLAEGGAAVAPEGSRESTPKKQTSEQAEAPPQPSSPIENVITSVKLMAEAAAKEAASAAAAATAASAASAAAASSISKETNTSPDRSSTSSAGAQTTSVPKGIPVTPSLENLIDPQFMKAGIQILNNFSEMFGKILDPVVTEGTSRSSSTAASSVNIDLTGENGATATPTPPPPTAAETPNKPGTSKQSSNAGSGLVTPMETESVGSAAAEPAATRSRNSQSEENDWTMIDNNAASATDAASSSKTAATAAAATAAPIDFLKLSQQLQSHIENEMKSNSFEMASPPVSVTPPQVSAPVPASPPAPAPIPEPVSAPTQQPTDKRAVVVFHANPRINKSVHAMMAMGFSNEGAVLTQLLESVDGSIPHALDLMADAQRN